MANTHATLVALFTATANAIRAKAGTAGTIKADNFPAAIAAIPTGPTIPNVFSINIENPKVYSLTIGYIDSNGTVHIGGYYEENISFDVKKDSSITFVRDDGSPLTVVVHGTNIIGANANSSSGWATSLAANSCYDKTVVIS